MKRTGKSSAILNFLPSSLRALFSVRLLEFASDHCRNDPELVNIALQNNGRALLYVGPSLQSKPEIIEAAIDNIGPFVVACIQQKID
ncbi:DUF4116 domain-containing protein [Thalassotalea sp. G20_0]|uniref:DUF4116 domain-containing protein n=1 Tax=Thalassotalea sp. G20_0 TaxID=2821093 RepID=UPI001ADD4FCD|nr:DUF4116 domain-containing protein [Thalassotalea sp. G20_0]MBO9496789.1 DUF4116 domain-containing protein [Thalassotalea sp. G20_0]